MCHRLCEGDSCLIVATPAMQGSPGRPPGVELDGGLAVQGELPPSSRTAPRPVVTSLSNVRSQTSIP